MNFCLKAKTRIPLGKWRTTLCVLAATTFFIASGIVENSNGQALPDRSIDSYTSSVISDLRHVVDSQLKETLSTTQLIAVHRLYEEQLRATKEKIFKLPDGKVAFGEELSRIARFYFSNTPEAETAQRLYEEIATDYKDEHVGAHANMMLGWLKQGIEKDPLGAVEFYEKAVKYFDENPPNANPPNGNPRSMGLALRTMNTAGDVHVILGNDNKAIAFYERVMDDRTLASDGVESTTRLNAAGALGRLMLKKQDYRNAFKRFRQAESLVADAGLPDDFALKCLLTFWEQQAKTSVLLNKKTFEFNVDVLEEIYYGLQDKHSEAGLQVGNLLLLCYRFGTDPGNRSRISDFASLITEQATEALKKTNNSKNSKSKNQTDPLASGKPQEIDTDRFEFCLAQQARLLRIEELKRTMSGEADPDEAIAEYIQILTQNNYPRFKPVVSPRLPNGMQIQKSLKEIYKRLIESKIMQSVLSADDEIVVTNHQLKGASYEIEVGYIASQDRDVVVELWKGKTFLGRAKEVTEAGEGTVTIPVPTNRPLVSDDDYVIKAGIRPTNASWREIISRVRIDKIKIEIESLKLVAENPIEIVTPRRCKVSVNHSLLRKIRDIQVVIYKGDQWLGSGKASFSGPERRVEIPVTLVGDLTDGKDYSVKAILLPLRDKGWKASINADERKLITLKTDSK